MSSRYEQNKSEKFVCPDPDLDYAIALSLSDADHVKSDGVVRENHRSCIYGKDDEDFALAFQLALEEESPPNPSTNAMTRRSEDTRISDGKFPFQAQFTKSLESLSRRCAVCKKSCQFKYITALNKQFHEECFCCNACNLRINGQFVQKNDLFFHTNCAEELFTPKCSLCCDAIHGKYYKHPFFADELYCVGHESVVKSCFACNRKEPLPKSRKEGFAELPDGRSICSDCVTTCILDSEEARPLYLEAVNFIEKELKIPIPPGMRDVPILAVDLPSLNENMQKGSGKSNHNTAITRGLTLSTRGEIRHMSPGAITWNPLTGEFITLRSNNLHRIDEIRDVTAVLVLCGLPRDLTASILAHEAFHVWIKLSKHMPYSLPPKVEEGMCQLLSSKYLLYLESSSQRNHFGREIDSETKAKNSQLRNYFQFTIETDPSPVYGDGFREAAEACQVLSFDIVLEYIRDNQMFPKV